MPNQRQQGVLLDPDNRRALAGPRALKDPNSVEYAIQTVYRLKRLYQDKQLSAELWVKAVTEAEDHRIYDRVPSERPYGSIDALLVAEIGTNKAGSIRDVAARANGTPPLAQNGAIGRGRNSSANRTPIVKGRGSESADYLTARIARDRPDILERMKAGAYSSVRAAAKDAGLVKERASVALTPAGFLRAMHKHLSADERRQVAQALTQEHQP